MTKYILALFILIQSTCFSMDCEGILKTMYSNINYRYILYLNRLLSDEIISKQEMLKHMALIERGKIQNPIGISKIRTANRNFQREVIQKIIISNKLDSKLLVKLYKELKISEAIVSKEKIIEDSKYIYNIMKFINIPSGSFLMGSGNKLREIDVDIYDSFELMQAPVTQHQWATIMNHNPTALFLELNEKEVHYINDKKIIMRPNHPIRSVSYLDIVGHYYSRQNVHALGKISKDRFEKESESNKKFYTYKKGFLETLNQYAKEDNPIIYQVIPDHRPGYIYRLPYNAEWEYVARNLGTNDNNYITGKGPKNIEDFAWTQLNAKGKFQQTQKRTPQIINNSKIYDLYGNVFELLEDNDYFQGSTILKNKFTSKDINKDYKKLSEFQKEYTKLAFCKKDQIGKKIIRGGSCAIPNTHEAYILWNWSSVSLNNSGRYTGFRLVREIIND